MLRRMSVRQSTQHNLICLTEGASFLQRAAEQLIQPERGIARLSSARLKAWLDNCRPVNSGVRHLSYNVTQYGKEGFK